MCVFESRGSLYDSFPDAIEIVCYSFSSSTPLIPSLFSLTKRGRGSLSLKFIMADNEKQQSVVGDVSTSSTNLFFSLIPSHSSHPSVCLSLSLSVSLQVKGSFSRLSVTGREKREEREIVLHGKRREGRQDDDDDGGKRLK